MPTPYTTVEALQELVRQLEVADEKGKAPIAEQANELAEKLVEATRQTYNRIADAYEAIRWEEPHELDKRLWRELLDLTREQVARGFLRTDPPNLKLLDVGTGNGRDLRFAQNEFQLTAVGIDNSQAFVSGVQELEAQGRLATGSIFHGDMRDLSAFAEHTFDIVRHNASLLHMPVIGPGYMADQAICESFRVLKPGGILYVFVKAGAGMRLVDTAEGLGERFYQFFTESSLEALLERNHFGLLRVRAEVEVRNNKAIPWLAAFAQRPSGF